MAQENIGSLPFIQPFGKVFIAADICQVRAYLLDALAGAVEQLGRAKLVLTVEKDLDRLFVAHTEVLRLREECGRIRLELEAHRAMHRC